MSADNVTPIRAGNGSTQPPKASRKPRKTRAQTSGVHLRESGEHEGFSTYEVLAGLRGVCDALDDRDWARNMDIDLAQRLVMAGKVLAAILHGREDL
jgi:hypothetical protein